MPQTYPALARASIEPAVGGTRPLGPDLAALPGTPVPSTCHPLTFEPLPLSRAESLLYTHQSTPRSRAPKGEIRGVALPGSGQSREGLSGSKTSPDDGQDIL
jgi:hypothetical protein